MIRLLYDVSVLGYGVRDPRNRAGVFRATEHLALGLAASDGIDLTFCASKWEDLYSTASYLRVKAQLTGVPFAPRQIEPWAIGPAAAALSAMWSGHRQSLVRRLIANALRGLLRLIDRYSSPLRPRDTIGYQLFHSPYHPLPSPKTRVPHLTYCLTIYDMIPVLFPELVRSRHRSSFSSILTSIRSDDYVICNSHTTKDDLCGHSEVDPRHVFVVPLAAAPELFHPVRDPEIVQRIKEKYGIPGGNYVLSVNTIEPRKNMDHAIRSFARLVQQERIRDLSFVLVGARGWDYQRVFTTLAECGLPPQRVVVTGHVPDADLAALYTGALCFVYPSLYEGFGLPLLEAMQCGVPAIASNTSALPEVVGDAGVLIDPTDGEALCQAVLELYLHPSRRAALSHKSLVRARLFTWERCTRETVAVYRAAIGDQAFDR
jgi:glycosyltransferase involved in cell wall biosynthesis